MPYWAQGNLNQKEPKYINLPNTEILAKEIITLPMYPNLNKREIHRVIKNIENWYKENVKKK